MLEILTTTKLSLPGQTKHAVLFFIKNKRQFVGRRLTNSSSPPQLGPTLSRRPRCLSAARAGPHGGGTCVSKALGTGQPDSFKVGVVGAIGALAAAVSPVAVGRPPSSLPPVRQCPMHGDKAQCRLTRPGDETGRARNR